MAVILKQMASQAQPDCKSSERVSISDLRYMDIACMNMSEMINNNDMK